MDNNIIVSIIMPIYNTANYLKRAIDSVLNQSIKEIELILVDDGSTDNSAEIYSSYLSDSKVRLVNLEHRGQGEARNEGLKIARGKYIGFVDSDDYIDSDMYAAMVAIIEKNRCDVVVCDVVYEHGKEKNIQKSVESDFTKENYLMNGINLCSSCNKLFKSKVFEGLMFPDIAYEDMALIPLVIAKSESIIYIQQPYYHYCKRLDSTSMTYIGRRVKEMIPAMDILLSNISEEFKDYIEYWIVNSIFYCINEDKGFLIANFADFVRYNYSRLIKNKYISREFNLKVRLKELKEIQSIPKRIICANIGERVSKVELEKFKEHLLEMNPDYEIVIFNNEDIKMEQMPISIKRAYKIENYEIINEYIKAQEIVKAGGMSVSLHLAPVSSIDYIRDGNGVLGFKSRQVISLDFWGSVQGGIIAKLISEILEENSTEDIEMIENILSNIVKEQFGAKLNGRTQFLEGNIKVYNPGYFLFDIGEKNQVMYSSIQEKKQLVDSGLLRELAGGTNILREFNTKYEADKKKNDILFSVVCLVSNSDEVEKNFINHLFSADNSFSDKIELILWGEENIDKDYNNASNITFLSKKDYTFAQVIRSVNGEYCGIFTDSFVMGGEILKSIYVHMITSRNVLDIFFLENGIESRYDVVDLQLVAECKKRGLFNAIVKSDVLLEILNGINFDIDQEFGALVRVLMDKKKYGIYFNSQIVKEEADIQNVFKTQEEAKLWIDNNIMPLIGDYIDAEWKNYKFLQYMCMYNIQAVFWVKEDWEETVRTSAFKLQLSEILENISDDIILQQQEIYIEHKIFVLNIKYREYMPLNMLPSDVSIGYNREILKMSSLYTMIDLMIFEHEKLEISGRTMCLNYSEDEEVIIYAKVNGEIFVSDSIDRSDMDRRALNTTYFKSLGFKFTIPIHDEVGLYEIKLFYSYKGYEVARNKLVFGPFSPLGNVLETGYYYSYPRAFYYSEGVIYARQCGRKGLIEREYRYQKDIKNDTEIINSKEIVRLRRWALILKKIIRKPIWILSDKINAGDDNAEVFFEYLNRNKKGEVNSYFILDKNSQNYNKLKKIGKVVPYLSFKHKLLFLLSKRNISSQSNDYVLFPFAKDYHYFRDLTVDTKFVFLQHGITQNDLSSWLHKYNRNISWFVTAAVKEYDSILNGKYHYTENEILLAGFARFDRLYHAEDKIITIIPTWRKYLFNKYNSDINKAIIEKGFKNTLYYKFYRELLSNMNLHECAEKHGYKIALMLHPNARPFTNYFSDIKDLIIFDQNENYTDVYAKSNLMVTDYSSAVFDFAYLRKPVLYCQFDSEDFFGGQHSMLKGYYDYETMGFGEVEYDVNGTINRIKKYIENDCQLKELYRKRIDEFFAFDDFNNCERIYEGIK